MYWGKYFTNRKHVTLYACNTLHENTAPLAENVDFFHVTQLLKKKILFLFERSELEITCQIKH